MSARARRALGQGEPVRVLASGPGGLPKQFTFRGRRYLVRSAAARPDLARPPKHPLSLTEWMEVRTESGLRAILSWRRHDNHWRMEGILK